MAERRDFLKAVGASSVVLNRDWYDRLTDGRQPTKLLTEGEDEKLGTTNIEDTAGYVRFENGDFTVSVLPGEEDMGQYLMQSVLWGVRLTHEYRPFEFEGRCAFWMHRPTPLGEYPNGGTALSWAGVGDIFLHYPPRSEITPLDDVDDPRESDLFKTLMHEYIHVDSPTIRGEVGTGYTYPAGWLEHGFTEYTTWAHYQGYYEHVFELVEEDRLPQTDNIVGYETYAVGLFIMLYLVDEYGMDAVVDIYKHPSEDSEDYSDVTPAVEDVLGVSIDEFNSNWQAAVTSWFGEFDEPPTGVENILQPDEWPIREPGQDDITVGDTPDVSATPDVFPSGVAGGIVDSDGRVTTEGLRTAIDLWRSEETVYDTDS